MKKMKFLSVLLLMFLALSACMPTIVQPKEYALQLGRSEAFDATLHAIETAPYNSLTNGWTMSMISKETGLIQAHLFANECGFFTGLPCLESSEAFALFSNHSPNGAYSKVVGLLNVSIFDRGEGRSSIVVKGQGLGIELGDRIVASLLAEGVE